MWMWNPPVAGMGYSIYLPDQRQWRINNLKDCALDHTIGYAKEVGWSLEKLLLPIYFEGRSGEWKITKQDKDDKAGV